jgi:hypothetical protein
MPTNAVFHWLDGRGWLILAGETPAADAVRSRALSVAAADGAVACVAPDSLSAEQLLTDMESLGAPPGYVIDLLAEDDQTIYAHLAEAGMIVIGAETTAAGARSNLLGVVIDGIRTAYENGAVILVEGSSAMMFGAWVFLENGQLVDGVNWLQGSLILPGVPRAADAPQTQRLVAEQGAVVAIGIGTHSALALGPDGQVEIWGEQEVTIALGPNFGA